jgi:hypothetical protein
LEDFSYGALQIDGTTRERDVVVDRGEVRKRKKKVSKKLREAFGHTPLSLEEEMPWKRPGWRSARGHMAICR